MVAANKEVVVLSVGENGVFKIGRRWRRRQWTQKAKSAIMMIIVVITTIVIVVVRGTDVHRSRTHAAVQILLLIPQFDRSDSRHSANMGQQWVAHKWRTVPCSSSAAAASARWSRRTKTLRVIREQRPVAAAVARCKCNTVRGWEIVRGQIERLCI